MNGQDLHCSLAADYYMNQSNENVDYVFCTLGPQRSEGVCVTCGLNWTDALPLHRYLCPGHFGYIQLPVPVFSPLLFSEMFSVCIRHKVEFQLFDYIKYTITIQSDTADG